MKQLWAPWRMAFIEPKDPPPPGCIFCTQPAAHEDEKYHILHRGEQCFMMLNLYPYNNGHLMVAPYEHVGALDLLSPETLADMMSQAQWAIRALRAAMNPDGFNMGINMGKVAGAGFAEHIHYHIVPRWDGDTNFMPVISDIKVVPEHLDVVYQKLLQALAETRTEH
ncbi:HIT family protein [Dictyobacter formicarum]|nr:HIT domain-containing protein [Dictyobacter formicarum]